jgi:hypothetical protein
MARPPTRGRGRPSRAVSQSSGIHPPRLPRPDKSGLTRTSEKQFVEFVEFVGFVEFIEFVGLTGIAALGMRLARNDRRGKGFAMTREAVC